MGTDQAKDNQKTADNPKKAVVDDEIDVWEHIVPKKKVENPVGKLNILAHLEDENVKVYETD